MKAMLFVFLGGGAGSVLRYAVGRAALALLPGAFPWGIFIVNVVGGLAAGLLFGWISPRSPESGSLQLLLMTGFLGGFTTFSAFSLDAVLLWQRGQAIIALAYVVASVVVAVAAVVAGLLLGRAV